MFEVANKVHLKTHLCFLAYIIHSLKKPTPSTLFIHHCQNSHAETFNHSPNVIIPPVIIAFIKLIPSLSFSRGRLCENVFEGPSHYHVHAQRPSGWLLSGSESRPSGQQAQTGLGVSFFKKTKKQINKNKCIPIMKAMSGATE